MEDDAVNQSLERIRERNARYEAVESGAVEAGHTVVVGLERRGTDKEGKQGDVDKHEQVSIELGAPSNPPGFDAEVIGMTPGSSKSFTITYPDDYAIPELAGGKVDYTVNLKEIKKRVVPALDDELAKDLGDFSSLEELRTRVREDLEHEAMHAAERQVRQDVMKQLASRVPFRRARVARRSRDRSPARGFRAALDGAANRSAPGEHRLECVPRRPARAGHRSGRLGDRARRDRQARGRSRSPTRIWTPNCSATRSRRATASPSIRARLQKDGELGRLAAGSAPRKSRDARPVQGPDQEGLIFQQVSPSDTCPFSYCALRR